MLTMFCTEAFTTPQHHITHRSGGAITRQAPRYSSPLLARRGRDRSKKEEEALEESKVDYVAIAGMLVNPLNPYSWFLYFFVAINLYASTQQ